MSTLQSNTERLIYVLHKNKPKQTKIFCKLNNNLYLTKEPKSDEKLVITEKYMLSVIRVVLFMYTFNISILETINQIYKTGEITLYIYDDTKKKSLPILEDINSIFLNNKVTDLFLNKHYYNISDAINLLDNLFGYNFSLITSKPIKHVFKEYSEQWLSFPLGTRTITTISAIDILNLFNFYTSTQINFLPFEVYLFNNLYDNKIYLQNAIKHL